MDNSMAGDHLVGWPLPADRGDRVRYREEAVQAQFWNRHQYN